MAQPRIEAVTSPGRFLGLQRAFYRGDPHYVPPLAHAERWQVDRRRNPFFAHAEVGLFRAVQDGKTVGRISTTRDRLHDDFHGDRVGFFGHFEAADAQAAQTLLDHAGTWLAARGANELRGPVDLSTNYRCGLLIEGEAGSPVLAMPYNPPRYRGYLEAFGLTKAKDLLALRLRKEDMQIERMARIAERLGQRNRVTMRPLDTSRFKAEVAILWSLYHRIWERNWGFVPMSREEFTAQAKDFKSILVPELAQIASIDGEPVAFGIALPDVNVAIKACGGRLFPFGFLRLFRVLKTVTRIRVMTLGIVPERRAIGLDSMLIHRIVSEGLARGFDECEASWILEDNHTMLKPLFDLGSIAYRRYRIYGKRLGTIPVDQGTELQRGAGTVQ